ncbi:MAG: methylated-DNA--[protein]-cysteine S-methyltransferase, partial [Chitinophagales bacterium]
SPVGLLEISADENSITALNFCHERKQKENPSSLTKECAAQLKDFFAGRRKDFSLKLNPSGTDFQIQVWNELQKIPFGKTISYLELARRLGDEKKIRAAGTANGRNPIPIIIPCHRVIGSDGSLVGYGGGLPKKKWLLEFESGIKQTQLAL